MVTLETLLQNPSSLYSQPVASTASLAGTHAVTTFGSFVTTTTPSAILVHNVLNQRCIASIPALSGSLFTSPAEFVMETNQSKQHSETVDDTPVVGQLVAASEATVQIWKIDSTFTAFGEPKFTKKLSAKIQGFSVIKATMGLPKEIVVVLVSGQINVLSMELDRVLSTWTPPPPKTSLTLSETVYSASVVPDHELGHVSILQVTKHTVSKDAQPTYTCRVLILSELKGKHTVTLTTEFILDLPTVKNTEFAFNASSALLAVVASPGSVFIFELERQSKHSKLSLDLSAYMDQPKKSSKDAIRKFDVAVLSENHVAVLSQKKNVDILSIWETKYGSLQAELRLNDVDAETVSRGTRILALALCETSSVGKAMIALESHSNSSTVFTTASIVPYYCAPVTLLSAIGKRQSTHTFKNHDHTQLAVPLATIVSSLPPATFTGIGSNTKKIADVKLKNWVDQIKLKEAGSVEFLSKLADEKQTPTASVFNDVFAQWVSTTNGSSTLDSSDKPLLLPAGGLSHATVHTIARRCFEDPSKFWPRTVIESIIVSGALTSQSVGGEGLIPVLVAKADYELIDHALRHVCDIKEHEYVHLLRHVCAVDPATSVQCRDAMDLFCEQRKSMKKRSKSDLDPKTPMQTNTEIKANGLSMELDCDTTDTTLSTETSVQTISKGQRYFFKGIFLATRNDLKMAQALRLLGIRELGVVITFLSHILCPEFSTELDASETDRFPLWWLWSVGSERDQKAYDEWLMAVDALALILDAHLSSTILSNDLSDQIERLQVAVKRDLRLLQLYESKLRGPLAGLAQERSVPIQTESMISQEKAISMLDDGNVDEGSERAHGRRWRQLLEQVQSGTGDYSVEVLKLQY
ncbi:hypothetical protein BATDEDRAFT_34268 [Batrachochytrium dendrobatidis JAM81]|uniref:Uncharacterized protein n=2 Tax=Batrachochytrium dendrobatidis TaxID=109871 RepID=F4NTX9_BATDJ|nr:uncharacterized protein BATDEDRAFT_34268 [Batrachochytrium dendrobatidis JAM81]EGF84371.1 hypothetical protein BATDEDRAFT_34268 [Batrachochytrium dendrobatidis JAM81]OAJ37334.1 hypothetical protein BDEG_21368 [Batrachochytrium dendrobatidis JEL423]|eukprot:XP_006675808.1 hypothetical protein BATDEDRAFT_34268 [Batrachochytrium dendrobatidis JAM81]